MNGNAAYPAKSRAVKAPASAAQDDILTELRLKPELCTKWKYGRRSNVLANEAVTLGGHPPALNGGLKVQRYGGLEFINNFDSANGEIFPHGPDAERFHILLRPDPSDGAESTGRRRWFHFGVRLGEGQVAPVKARFVVNNLSNMLDLYNLDGHRPFCYQMPGAGTWRRLAEDCSFACHEEQVDEKGVEDSKKSPCRLKDECLLPRVRQLVEGEKKRKSFYIAWDFQVEHGITTYFAFSPPYNYASMQEYLNQLERFFESKHEGEIIPSYMPRIERNGGGSGTLSQRSAATKPPKVKVTVEHAACDPVKKMYIWVRKDASMLQVRQAIMEALGLKKLSLVRLVKRMGSDKRLMTSMGDSERLSQKSHVLMMGYDFPDGFSGPEPQAEEPRKEEALPLAQGGESHQWEPCCGENVYFHRQRLCLSKEGRRIDLLTLSEDLRDPTAKQVVEAPPEGFRTCSVSVDGDTPARHFARPIIFVSARVHPGETPGQFAFLGFLRFLISDDPRAALLRQQFVFKMVPMLNPDGVARGHTRANIGGLDLNRCYGDANPGEHEGVFWVLEWLKHWTQQGELLFYLDMHAHAHTRGCVLYGNRLPSTLSQVWNVAFAKFCELNGPHFDFQGCEFPPNAEKETESCGRACVAALCRLSHAYTLECHYSIGRQAHPLEDPVGLDERCVHPGMNVPMLCQVPYGIYEWESMGEALAVSILDLHGINSFSRPSAKMILHQVSESLSPGKSPEELEKADPKQALKRPDEDSGNFHDFQLWRVMHTMVVARENPNLEAQVLEVFGKGQLLAVAEEMGNWVRLHAPSGCLGGKLNTDLDQVRRPCAYMLIDGSAKGLGQLLQKTDFVMRLPDTENGANMFGSR